MRKFTTFIISVLCAMIGVGCIVLVFLGKIHFMMGIAGCVILAIAVALVCD